MKANLGQAYEFVFRGLLAEEALDKSGRRHPRHFDDLGSLEDTLSLAILDDEFVTAAKRMSVVYTAIAAFENSVRDLVSGVLLESNGANWWENCTSERVRKRAKTRREDEEKHRFHKRRGDNPINFTEFGDLANIIRANWDLYEAYLPSPEWASSIIESIERSRNVIMHSGDLDAEDVARVGILIRDWVKQVGA